MLKCSLALYAGVFTHCGADGIVYNEIDPQDFLASEETFHVPVSNLQGVFLFNVPNEATFTQ